jgi:hypothetical protein
LGWLLSPFVSRKRWTVRKGIEPRYSEKGRPGIETRFVVGLLLLMSDEGVCERWVYNLMDIVDTTRHKPLIKGKKTEPLACRHRYH